ncbi:hypothetical protein HN018_06780 [Lichenicola cladoniae]|uniref:Uncharacterized protein n=1 Tax=Lichenicola cladoniae TaxID=1484109 RepID=A0A6M8HN97_9PROT|nr:hypothetical protein [Lichenicola cladoniae]NPD67277.1 hypothetical protein [Acetobacteraceae bacterium]QKE89781.1 hypothetical protein HN018_06780 [Lichenicola cladoniae]
MNDITTITQDQITAVAAVPSMLPASSELGSTIYCLEQGLPPGKVVVAEDGTATVLGLAPAMVSEAQRHLEAIEPLLACGGPEEMMAWLCHLRHSVRNAPETWRSIQAKARAIWEDCSDLPRGVWCDETRRLWRRQPPRGDYHPGSYWPLPGELHAILLQYANQLRRDAAGCRRVLSAAAAVAEPVWERPSDEVRAQVAENLRQHRAWLEEQRLAAGDEERRPRGDAPAAAAGAIDEGPPNWAGAIARVVNGASAARTELAA